MTPVYRPWCGKSMNMLLHVMEGLHRAIAGSINCHLARCLRSRLRELVGLFVNEIWLAASRHFGLFFMSDWHCLSSRISYGHDIETAWLLQRAAVQRLNFLA